MLTGNFTPCVTLEAAYGGLSDYRDSAPLMIRAKGKSVAPVREVSKADAGTNQTQSPPYI